MALFAGLLAYGLLGSSRFAIVSSTSSSAAVLAAATASVLHVSDDLRHLMGVAMVLTAGVIFVVAGLARLGSVSQFIAKPVLRGFALGLALTIVVKQLPVAVAVHPAHSDFLRYAWDLLSQWRLWNLHGLAMMLAALLALRLLGRWKALPGALLVIAAGIGLDALGYCQAWGIAPVGTLAIGGSRPALPSLALADWLRVGQLAMALALILYAESYSSIRSLALRHGDAVSPNRDLVALAWPMRCPRCSRACRWGPGIRPAPPTRWPARAARRRAWSPARWSAYWCGSCCHGWSAFPNRCSRPSSSMPWPIP